MSGGLLGTGELRLWFWSVCVSTSVSGRCCLTVLGCGAWGACGGRCWPCMAMLGFGWFLGAWDTVLDKYQGGWPLVGSTDCCLWSSGTLTLWPSFSCWDGRLVVVKMRGIIVASHPHRFVTKTQAF